MPPNLGIDVTMTSNLGFFTSLSLIDISMGIIQSWFYSGALCFAPSNTMFSSMLSISPVALIVKATLYLAYRKRNFAC